VRILLRFIFCAGATVLIGCVASTDFVQRDRRLAQKDYLAARDEAKRDIQNGNLAYEVHGLLSSHFQECQQLLRDRHNIELRCVGGCVVDESVEAHAKGYNEIMRPEIEQRFGTNLWAQVETDAKKLYEGKHGLKQ
jgi:hypothetical protein